MADVAAATRGVGVLLGLLGSIGINVGNNMQALGMGKLERQKRRDRRGGTPPPEEMSGRASSSGELAASPTRAGAGASSPATDLEDDSSSSAEAEHPNVVALRSLKEPNAAGPTRSHSLDAPPAARAPDGPRSKDDIGVGVGRKNSKEHAKDGSTASFKDRPLRPLVRTLTDSAIAITDSVGTLVPQLTPSLLSPRMATLGSARGMESRDSFDSLDSVEYAGRIECVFGGQCIKTVGTIIFITGSVINFIAFALAPASILAPLESIQFVSNLVFAHFFTAHAKITRRMVIGSALVVGGTVLACVFGPSTVAEFDVQELIDFWAAPAWIVYEFFVFIAAAAVQAVWQMHKSAVFHGRPMRGHNTVLPVCYALSSAMVGTQSVVQAKCLSEIVSILFDGMGGNTGGDADVLVDAAANSSAVAALLAEPDTRGAGEIVFTSWFTYFVIGYFLVSVGFWLYRLQSALSKYDPLFIIPLLQASYIVFATIGGGLYFQELQTMAPHQWIFFSGGILVMLSGLYLLTPENHPPPDPDIDPQLPASEAVRV